jgi:hypothetical protein
MNLNLVNVIVFGIGAILVYGAVKDKDPRKVVQEALGQKAAPGKPANVPAAPKPSGPSTVPATYLPPTYIQPNNGPTYYGPTDGPVLSV